MIEPDDHARLEPNSPVRWLHVQLIELPWMWFCLQWRLPGVVNVNCRKCENIIFEVEP
jgi:hypothetical protein